MTTAADTFARKLSSIVDLAEEEREAVRALPMVEREFQADHDIAREGDRPTQSCLIVQGFAFRYKLAGEGRRQILAFHIPGEIPDLQSLHLKTMDHSVATLTRARVGFTQHRALFDLMSRFPRIAGALWRETLIDAAVFREWMVGLGRREALGRIAHLFCEVYVRMKAVGMAEDGSMEMPITQGEIADALGLSAVHVNRSLQSLRSAGLITLRGGRLTIEDWKGLQEAGEFDPTYLHQNPDRQPEAV